MNPEPRHAKQFTIKLKAPRLGTMHQQRYCDATCCKCKDYKCNHEINEYVSTTLRSLCTYKHTVLRLWGNEKGLCVVIKHHHEEK